MKIKSARIKRFKRYENLPEISFVNGDLGEISDRLLVLGDNGSGKTSLLQAIALTLDLATCRIRSMADFDWPGFLPDRYMRWGPPRVELDVVFSESEIAATVEVAQRWRARKQFQEEEGRHFVAPGTSREVTLVLDGDTCRARTRAQYLQFRGRHYAYQLLKEDPTARDLFAALPGAFWFDQFRNMGVGIQAIGDSNGVGAETKPRRRLGYEAGVDSLRTHLTKWKLSEFVHPGRSNWLEQIEGYYSRLFPGRSFAGLEERSSGDSVAPDDYCFLLGDGRRTDDIVEASSGEQSVFPLLFEFVRMQIAHSVVLIDEVDLNLHPPAAQALVSQLRSMAPTCQFILTTHSGVVNSIIGEADTRRLAGGQLCL